MLFGENGSKGEGIVLIPHPLLRSGVRNDSGRGGV
jgi:hypothetical protein